ncbi:MAG TPA: Nif3-like dinuclear metal center hexameric protein [Candidatus Kryptonia bacterium]
MNLRDVIKTISEKFPIELVSENDNVGLICGDYEDECSKMTVAYELNDRTLKEAGDLGSNLVVTYHTPIFKPVRNLTSSRENFNPVLRAARMSINVFTIHTALDVMHGGINWDFAERFGFKDTKFLSPLRSTLYKLVVFVPASHLESVRKAISLSGGGRIGDYSECSFDVAGNGTFIPGSASNPFVGTRGKRESVEEERVEVVVEKQFLGRVIKGMVDAHPYEEVAYDVYPLVNESPNYGYGIVGNLEHPMDVNLFLGTVKRILSQPFVRVSHMSETEVTRVAFCAGSGMGFYGDAVGEGADIFVTGDVRHHDFRTARSGKMVLVDASHSGTERYAPALIQKALKELFTDKVDVTLARSQEDNAVIV